jgi:multiple sugar transport system substrate-binding protein
MAVLALGLAACTSGGGDEPDATGAGGGEGDAVTIRMWAHQNNAFNEGYQALIDEYQAANPGVTIELEPFDYDTYIQTLQTALPAGSEADILQMFGTWACSYADNLARVPESVITLADAEAAVFPGPLAGYECDGELVGFPQEYNIEYGAVLVNTSYAEAAGVDVSAGWSSWDEFIADAKSMAVVEDGAMTRAGYNFTAGDATAFTFFSLIKQAGGEFYDGEAFTIDTPEARQALELMKRMVDEGVVDPVLFNDEANWVGQSFFDGSSAMGLVGPWVVAEYAGDFPETLEVTRYVPLPNLGEARFVVDSGWGLAVSANSEVQEQAWDFVRFVTLDADNARGWNIGSGTLPALVANTEGAARDELLETYPYFEPFLPLLADGVYLGSLPDRDLLWYDIAGTHIQNVYTGAETIDDALAAMEREANETTG